MVSKPHSRKDRTFLSASFEMDILCVYCFFGQKMAQEKSCVLECNVAGD
jgi:hypothetical protein